MNNRRLVLRSESLTELSTGELGDVVGGAPSYEQCPDDTYYCLTGYGMCERNSIALRCLG